MGSKRKAPESLGSSLVRCSKPRNSIALSFSATLNSFQSHCYFDTQVSQSHVKTLLTSCFTSVGLNFWLYRRHTGVRSSMYTHRHNSRENMKNCLFASQGQKLILLLFERRTSCIPSWLFCKSVFTQFEFSKEKKTFIMNKPLRLIEALKVCFFSLAAKFWLRWETQIKLLLPFWRSGALFWRFLATPSLQKSPKVVFDSKKVSSWKL